MRLSELNYGTITNSSGGKPKKRPVKKSNTTKRPVKKSNTTKRPVKKSTTKRPVKKSTTKRPVKKSMTNRIINKSSNIVRKFKKMISKKGGATGLPARWYNNDAVGRHAEHSSNSLSDKYGEYNTSSLGNANLYPFSPYTSSDPFTMTQDNKIGGARKSSPKKKVRRNK